MVLLVNILSIPILLGSQKNVEKLGVLLSIFTFLAFISWLVGCCLNKDYFSEARKKEAKVFKSNGFNSEMIKKSVTITKLAFNDNNSKERIARRISTDFKEKFGGNYSCIVSTSDYDENARPNNNYVHLFLGVFRVELFSTVPPPSR